MLRFWFIARVWWLGFWWYGLTRALLRRGGEPVELADNPEAIAQRLAYGDRYKADGRLDTMRAPRVIQARINAGAPLGDCDDHASYWAACLDKSALAWRVYLAQVHGMGREGKPSGHLFTIWLDADGDWWAADYSVRGPFPTPREAAEEIAQGVGMAPRVAAWVRVDWKPRDRLAHVWRESGRVVW